MENLIRINRTLMEEFSSRDPVEKINQISAVSHDPPSSTVVKPPLNPL
jgi:hypothetical protein